MVDAATVDQFDVVKCAGCNKDVFPSERLIALKVIWHKGCLKCTTCGVLLTQKTMESWQRQPYCKAHLVKAKTGGGTQTAYTGSDNVKDAPRTGHDTKTWDPQADIQKAKASGFQAPEETRAEHDSQKRRDPTAELTALRAKGAAGPAEVPRAEHDSQKRRNPVEEIARLRAAAPQPADSEEQLTAHASQAPRNPAQEIAAARALAPNPVYDDPPPAQDYKREEIRGGNVTANLQKLKVAAAAPPAAVPKPAASKAAPKFKPAPAVAPAPPPPAPVHVAQPQDSDPDPQPEPQPEPEVAPQHDEALPVVDLAAAAAAATAASWAVALYDYGGEQEGDLSFSAGEQIQILDTSDPDGWWRGQLASGAVGVFPSNFVQMNQ